MIVLLAISLIGAAFGAWRAGQRGGTGADKVQWAIVHAIIFGVIALFAMIALGRLAYG